MKDFWVVRLAVMDDDGLIAHVPLDDLTLDFIRSFPHRVDVWCGDEWVAGGAFDDQGLWFPCTEVDPTYANYPLALVVDLLGIEVPA